MTTATRTAEVDGERILIRQDGRRLAHITRRGSAWVSAEYHYGWPDTVITHGTLTAALLHFDVTGEAG